MIPHHEQTFSSSDALPPPLLVDTTERLGVLRQALKTASRLAVDTESNSLYAYRERVCLIQLSTDQADFLLDPLAFTDVGDSDFLGSLFADPSVEKVFHAAEYDIMVLRRDFGFQFVHIFDTGLAARILGWQDTGLGAILQAQFGIHANKRHQRANWGRRPLAPELIRYAQSDIHYLLPLRDRLYPLLEKAGYIEEIQEISEELCGVVWNGGRFDPDGFWRINGVRSLSYTGAAILRELYLYREEQARRLDVPVFKVISDQALVTIAANPPRSLGALSDSHTLSEGQIRRFGRGVLSAIERGQRATPPRPPHRINGHDDLIARRFEALHEWRKERASRRGVPSDIIVSKDAMLELAQAAPRTLQQLSAIQSLGPWRIKVYGEEILRVLAGLDSTPAPGDQGCDEPDRT